MTYEAALLVLLSALLHPLRDLILKGSGHPELAYLAVTGGWVAIAAVHALVSGAGFDLGGDVWLLAVVSAACLAAYYFGTMSALKTGDLSVYYPIIRSSPLLIVLLTWAFGGMRYTGTVLAGIGLVVLAGFMLQRQPGQLVASPRTAAVALIAMAGSAGYTICDAQAMQRVAPATFLFWVYLIVTPAYAALAAMFRPAGTDLRAHLTGGWSISMWRIAAASIVSYLSYVLILMAFVIGAGAAETAAIRQFSIPVTVILSALVLGETRFVHRLGWASLIAAGIALIALQR